MATRIKTRADNLYEQDLYAWSRAQADLLRAGRFAELDLEHLIEEIEDVDMDDLHPESLWQFRIKGFGPLLVTMDSHGGSLHADVNKTAADRRAAVLASIGASE